MREVQVWVRCDRCRERFDIEAPDAPVQEGVPFTFNNDEVMLDLCTACTEILENEFASLLAAGRRIRPITASKRKKKAAATGEAETVGKRCPECEAEGVTRILESPQGFAVHRFRAHGVPGDKQNRRNRSEASTG